MVPIISLFVLLVALQLSKGQDVQPISMDKLSESSDLRDSPENAYVALCLIAKNEHKFIREWVDYHKYIGVKKFYIYDHNSTIPMQELVEDYVKNGLVDYMQVTDQWMDDPYKLNDINFFFSGEKQVNTPLRWAHKDCFHKNSHKHQFMAFIDIDEFVVLNQGKFHNYMPVQNPHLPSFLKKYEGYGGLFVFWRIYGSSGHKKSPPGGVLENYLNCQQDPSKGFKTNVKHFVNTQYMGDAFCVIHTCNTTKKSVDSLFREKNMHENRDFPQWESISLNHYMIKSLEDFNQKVARGGGHSPNYRKQRGSDFFKKINKVAKGRCSFMTQLYQACCSQQSSDTQ